MNSFRADCLVRALNGSEHNKTYDLGRLAASIKEQYQTLLQRREPTGDPNCPPDVKLAKAVERKLKAKQRAGDISYENGGPVAALAGMETKASDDGRTRLGGGALVQKRAPQKTSNTVEKIFKMQAMQYKEQSRREERHEQLFLNILSAGFTALTGKSIDTAGILANLTNTKESFSGSSLGLNLDDLEDSEND